MGWEIACWRSIQPSWRKSTATAKPLIRKKAQACCSAASNGDLKRVTRLVAINNAREEGARHNRYLLTPEDYLRGEREAARQGLDVLGVFHSHPDHPNRPSEFDRAWAMPWFSYLITSVEAGCALESRSWKLADDRSSFIEEPLVFRPA
jgi:proteasome lid subunit RPN8/RPN11